jgi:hypothetical protein
MSYDREATTADPSPDAVCSSFSSRHHALPSVSIDRRITELEIENSRLQRLVAELLLKNQQLRKEQA